MHRFVNECGLDLNTVFWEVDYDQHLVN